MAEDTITNRLSLYKANFSGALHESFDLARSYPERFRNKTLPGKILSIGKMSLIPASIYLTPAASFGVQATGATILTGVFFLQRLKNNNHTNALSAPVAFALSAQKASLDAWGYAVMAGIAGIEKVTMAMLPDSEESQALRKKVGYGFAALSVAGVGATGFLSPWNFMTLGSRLLGTWASTMINEKSYKARALHTIGCLNNAAYSFFYSGSGAATIIDSMGAVNKLLTIHENDIPVIRLSDHHTLTRSEQVVAYISTLKNHDNRSLYKLNGSTPQ